MVEMIVDRWHPTPFPTWVTCVPSLSNPTLVPDFAVRLATALGLPFVDCIRKIQSTGVQKEMMNSFQAAHNLDGAFVLDRSELRREAVLLVDDMVDSRCTFTILAALLKQEGVKEVYPVALATVASGYQ
jgi:ATP-dependent DNA helicase RecQ